MKNRTASSILLNSLIASFLTHFSCSNPTALDLKKIIIETNPETSFEILLDGVVYHTPVENLVKEGETVSIIAKDTAEEATMPVIQGADTRYLFLGWQNKTLSKAISIRVISDTVIKADLIKQCRVETETNPAGIAFIQGSGWHAASDSVVLSAPEVKGYAFDKWEINGYVAGNSDPLKISITEPELVTAIYKRKYIFAVSSSPDSGLKINIDSMQFVTPCSFRKTAGELVLLEAPPVQEEDRCDSIDGSDTRYSFIFWSDGFTANPRTIVIDKDIALIARTAISYKVMAATAPEGIGAISGGGWYASGSTASLTAPRIAGYSFVRWVIEGISYGNQEILSLPVDAPKKVIAAYVPGYSLIINTLPASGLVIGVDGTAFVSPVNTSKWANSNIVIEPQRTQDIDMSAVVAGPDSRLIFSQWADDDTTSQKKMLITRDTILSCRYRASYKLEAAADPAGLTLISGEGWHNEGDTVKCIAPPVANYQFDHWQVNGISRIENDTLQCTINEPKKVTAIYRPIYLFTVETYPDSGLSVKIDSSTFLSPKSMQRVFGSMAIAAVAPMQEFDLCSLVTGTDVRYTFVCWNDMATANPRTILIDRDIALRAQMDVKYKLEASILPDSIGGIQGSGWYENGSSATLFSPAINGYQFSYWIVNGKISGKEQNIIISIDQAKKITAIYQKIYAIKLSTFPDTGLPIQVNGKSYKSPAAIQIAGATSACISAPAFTEQDRSPYVSGMDSRYYFTSWSDGADTNARIVSINSDTTLIANMCAFYKVETSTSPESIGVVTIDSASDSGWHKQGTQVIFIAPYQQFYALDHWKINGATTNIANSISVNIDDCKAVQAIYRDLIYLGDGESYIQFSNLSGENYYHKLADGPAPDLPLSLIIQPGNYHYGQYNIAMQLEGLYRFYFPSTGFQQRIVYSKDTVTLISSIAKIATHGSSDNLLTQEELNQKAMQSNLNLTCSYLTGYAWSILHTMGIQCRSVLGLTLDNWNDANNGHTLNEIYIGSYQKWVAFDLDFGTYFRTSSTPLSFIELCDALSKGQNFQIEFLTNPPKIDEQTLLTLYARLMQVPMIWSDGAYYFFDTENRTRIEGYSPSYKFISREVFFQTFYGALS